MKARSKDWGTRLVGRRVNVRSRDVLDGFVITRQGTLCGWESDGDGNITVVRVAYAPADWQDVPVSGVELAS